jgi:endo-1,4-beta-mannosidase
MKKIFWLIFLCAGLLVEATAQKQWSASKADEWYAKQGWLRGCNYQPSTAINQLEMFQAETFDTVTINRELGWARDLGLNTMRVFLHHLLWTTDKDGFKKRLDQYLAISSRNKVRTILVFFDDCWNDSAKAGMQPAPKTGIHNSGWVRDPGTVIFREPQTVSMLKSYVQDVLSTFKNDDRIVLWDLYNEPGNNKQFGKSLPLLQQVFAWAREVNPSQPISAGLWSNDPEFTALNKFQLDNSDVITYHDYGYIDHHLHTVDTLKKFGRPLICTEYMARKNGSLFQVIMPMLKNENVGAINWGFVSGKTNTIYAWSTPMPEGGEPPLWFHDIYRKDGTPFSKTEVEFIKKLCTQ